MVEGPMVQRCAIAHRALLLGYRFKATSPNGRFVDGAAAINGYVLSHIEAHGKNIFYFFTPKKVKEEGVLEKLGDGTVVVHIHFGMSGSFQTYNFPGPEPREATRLQLINEEETHEAHLSASVCNYGDIELYQEKLRELGPDPVRADADKELVWASMQSTKRSIGAILMDQSVIAGVGNIYRSEILLVVGLHPEKPAYTVTRPEFEFLWDQTVRLMEIGVQTGWILTTLPEDADKPIPKKEIDRMRYVYNQKACGKCGGVVKTWRMAQRGVYACETCQPPSPVIVTSSKRVSASRKKVVATPSAESADSDSVIEVETVSTEIKGVPRVYARKKVAEGGKVVVHQALKDMTTEGLNEDLNTLVKETQGKGHVLEVGIEKAPKSRATRIVLGEDKSTEKALQEESAIDKVPKSSRTRRKVSADNVNKLQLFDIDEKMDEALVEKAAGQQRSTRMRKQALPTQKECNTTTLGFRGMLDFSPPKGTRFHVETSPTSSVGSRIGSSIFNPDSLSPGKLFCVTPGRYLHGPARGIPGFSSTLLHATVHFLLRCW